MNLLLVHLCGFAVGAVCLLLLKGVVVAFQHARRRSVRMPLLPWAVRGGPSAFRVR
jgi:hypothetical protein